MKGHMEMLQSSVYAKAKRPTLRITPAIRQFIRECVKDPGKMSRKKIMRSLGCDEVKASLIFDEIKLERAKLGINNRNAEQRGSIYLIENEAFSGWIKCGMTTNIASRLEAYNFHDPMKRFSIVCSKIVQDRRRAESQLINDLSMKSSLQSGEWFRIVKEDAISIFENVK
jgi:hypothetical protein